MMDATTPVDLKQISVRPLADATPIELCRCGEKDIDRWLSREARGLNKINRVRVFCAHLGDGQAVQGMYALSFESKETSKLTQSFRKYAFIPVVYITYIAVVRSNQGKGLGSHLLVDALRRAYGVSSQVGFYGVALRSLNERTTKLHARYGFIPVDSNVNPLMLLPIDALEELFAQTPT